MTKKLKAGKPRGFAYMKIHDPDRLLEISRNGGLVSAQSSRRYRWDRETARTMAPRGGVARHKRLR